MKMVRTGLSFKAFARNNCGTVAVISTIMLTIAIAICALVMDFSVSVSKKIRMQSAADLAALSGAIMLQQGASIDDIKNASESIFANNYDAEPSDISESHAVNFSSESVIVTIRESKDNIFSRLPTNINAEATASSGRSFAGSVVEVAIVLDKSGSMVEFRGDNYPITPFEDMIIESKNMIDAIFSIETLYPGTQINLTLVAYSLYATTAVTGITNSVIAKNIVDSLAVSICTMCNQQILAVNSRRIQHDYITPGTNVYHALYTAINFLESYTPPSGDQVELILLMTDGVHNIQDPEFADYEDTLALYGGPILRPNKPDVINQCNRFKDGEMPSKRRKLLTIAYSTEADINLMRRCASNNSLLSYSSDSIADVFSESMLKFLSLFETTVRGAKLIE